MNKTSTNHFTHATNPTDFVQGCVCLPLLFDVQTCLQQMADIAEPLWHRGGRIDVHKHVNALFIRGYAPAEGDKPVTDRSLLTQLPAIRQLLYQLIPAQPQRVLLAKLCPGGYVKMHRDLGDYFERTIRLHFVMTTTPDTYMLCQGQLYQMHVGEIWAINNLAMHGVLNQHPQQERIHLIADFDPEPALLQLINQAQANLGFFDLDIINQLRKLSGFPQRPSS